MDLTKLFTLKVRNSSIIPKKNNMVHEQKSKFSGKVRNHMAYRAPSKFLSKGQKFKLRKFKAR